MILAKPADIPQDVWEEVGEIFFTAANNHHAWGALEALPREWADDLQERIARAIMAAKVDNIVMEPTHNPTVSQLEGVDPAKENTNGRY